MVHSKLAVQVKNRMKTYCIYMLICMTATSMNIYSGSVFQKTANMLCVKRTARALKEHFSLYGKCLKGKCSREELRTAIKALVKDTVKVAVVVEAIAIGWEKYLRNRYTLKYFVDNIFDALPPENAPWRLNYYINAEEKRPHFVLFEKVPEYKETTLECEVLHSLNVKLQGYISIAHSKKDIKITILTDDVIEYKGGFFDDFGELLRGKINKDVIIEFKDETTKIMHEYTFKEKNIEKIIKDYDINWRGGGGDR